MPTDDAATPKPDNEDAIDHLFGSLPTVRVSRVPDDESE